MQHVLTNPKFSDIIVSGIYNPAQRTHSGVFSKFYAWCSTQEHNRLLWMALTFCGLIVFALPCTALPFLLLGKNDISYWILSLSINVPVIALSLAAQPTKIILPALFISWTADVIIILSWIIAFVIK